MRHALLSPTAAWRGPSHSAAASHSLRDPPPPTRPPLPSASSAVPSRSALRSPMIATFYSWVSRWRASSPLCA
jgi:hypothetical protein